MRVARVRSPYFSNVTLEGLPARAGVVIGEHELLLGSDRGSTGSVPAMSAAIASPAAFRGAIAGARDVALCSYTLRDGRVLDALIAAARRGATVRVRLERDPLDDAAGNLHRANAAAVAALNAAGGRATVTGSDEPALHMKAAVVDGVAWLSDRNWASGGPERIVRDDDPADVAAVAAAAAGGAGSARALATTKSSALRLEADVIARGGCAAVSVESESFGGGSVYDALLHRAKAGLATRLIVAGREVAASPGGREAKRLHRLARSGVQVRVGDPRRGDLDEKLAVSAAAAWVGSANATFARGAYGAQRDWGMATHAPALRGGLSAAFERNWQRARPLATER